MFTFHHLNNSYNHIDILFKNKFYSKSFFEHISILNGKNNLLFDFNLDILNKQWFSNVFESALDINNFDPSLNGLIYLKSTIQAVDNQITSNDFDINFNGSNINGYFNFDLNCNKLNFNLNELFFLNKDLNELTHNKFKNELKNFNYLSYQGGFELFNQNSSFNGLKTQYGDLNLDFVCNFDSYSLNRIIYSGFIVLQL